MMSTVFEDFSDHTAPPGNVTFSALDQAHGGHTVTGSNEEWRKSSKTSSGLAAV
jgi:hypothetical protein